MEFLLVNEKPFSMDKGECDQHFVLEPIALYYFKSLLYNMSVPIFLPLVKDVSAQCQLYPTLKIQLLGPNGHHEKPRFRVYSDDEINIMKLIRVSFRQDNVRINLKVTKLRGDVVGDGVQNRFEATDLPINRLDIDHLTVCGSETCDFNLDTRSKTSGLITVSIKFTERALGQLFLQRFAPSNVPCAGNRRLLDHAICTDLVIIAANEAKIKCHRAILAGRSDVFRTMFENEMQESITGVVEMRDRSEKAVRAFLGYIYYWNMKEASESCDTALEILVAGDKYNVPGLVSAISELIEFMPNEWFNVEMSVKFFVFAEKQRRIRNDHVLVQLQEKMIRVLKFHTKSFAVLFRSQVYQELRRDDREIALEISARFVSCNEQNQRNPVFAWLFS